MNVACPSYSPQHSRPSPPPILTLEGVGASSEVPRLSPIILPPSRHWCLVVSAHADFITLSSPMPINYLKGMKSVGLFQIFSKTSDKPLIILLPPLIFWTCVLTKSLIYYECQASLACDGIRLQYPSPYPLSLELIYKFLSRGCRCTVHRSEAAPSCSFPSLVVKLWCPEAPAANVLRGHWWPPMDSSAATPTSRLRHM